MALSLSLNCSTRKSSALTLLFLKNYWCRDCSSFSHSSCRHHIYTRNGRGGAEWQHIGRQADKEVQLSRRRENSHSHYWQKDLGKEAWNMGIELAPPFIGRSASLQSSEMPWTQCHAQNPVCHGSRQLCTSLLHSGRAWKGHFCPNDENLSGCINRCSLSPV